MNTTVNHNFGMRARQEMSRAERYCLFLSLMLIDMNELSRALAARTPGTEVGAEELRQHIEDGVRSALRASDVVASYDHSRIGVLLMETSRSGLEIVKQRISDFLIDYLRGTLQLPFEPAVTIRDASFPEESEQFIELTQSVNRVQPYLATGE